MFRINLINSRWAISSDTHIVDAVLLGHLGIVNSDELNTVLCAVVVNIFQFMQYILWLFISLVICKWNQKPNNLRELCEISRVQLTEQHNQIIDVGDQCLQSFGVHLLDHIILIASGFVLDEPLQHVFLSLKFVCKITGAKLDRIRRNVQWALLTLVNDGSLVAVIHQFWQWPQIILFGKVFIVNLHEANVQFVRFVIDVLQLLKSLYAFLALGLI